MSHRETSRRTEGAAGRGEPALPGLDVLTFEFISLEAATRLLLAADVPADGDMTHRVSEILADVHRAEAAVACHSLRDV